MIFSVGKEPIKPVGLNLQSRRCELACRQWHDGMDCSSPPLPHKYKAFLSQFITIHTTHTCLYSNMHAVMFFIPSCYQSYVTSHYLTTHLYISHYLTTHTYSNRDRERKKRWQSSTQTTLSRCVALIELTPPLACPMLPASFPCLSSHYTFHLPTAKYNKKKDVLLNRTY